MLKKTIVALLLVLAAPPALAMGSHAAASDGHGLVLYGDGGVPIASVTRSRTRYGGIALFTFAVNVAPGHRFQFATDDGAGYLPGSRVSKQFIELRSAALAAAAAERAGWRDPEAVSTYFVPVTSFVGDLRADGQVFIAITTNPTRSGFLIAITTVHLQPKGATTP